MMLVLNLLFCFCRMHEGILLKEDNPRFNCLFKRGLAMLTISDVNVEDAGHYSCTAINSVGSCTTVGELHVQGEQSLCEVISDHRTSPWHHSWYYLLYLLQRLGSVEDPLTWAIAAGGGETSLFLCPGLHGLIWFSQFLKCFKCDWFKTTI